MSFRLPQFWPPQHRLLGQHKVNFPSEDQSQPEMGETLRDQEYRHLEYTHDLRRFLLKQRGSGYV